MSYITEIKGWVELDGYEREKNHQALRRTKFTEAWSYFPRMFCFPSCTGEKNPDYLCFGASMNHVDVDRWQKRFEGLLRRLHGWTAYVIIAEEQHDPIFILYTLRNPEFGQRRMTKKKCTRLKIFFKDMYKG